MRQYRQDGHLEVRDTYLFNLQKLRDSHRPRPTHLGPLGNVPVELGHKWMIRILRSSIGAGVLLIGRPSWSLIELLCPPVLRRGLGTSSHAGVHGLVVGPRKLEPPQRCPLRLCVHRPH